MDTCRTCERFLELPKSVNGCEGVCEVQFLGDDEALLLRSVNSLSCGYYLSKEQNKCGSCTHFVYLNEPVDAPNDYQTQGKVNGVCLEESCAILRDSQFSACAGYDRKLSEGAVEEWEESF